MALKLLIVDDNPAVRKLIAHIAQPFAGDIFECSDGADALSAYQEQQPDLVLMDIRMKEVDGITATRQIKANEPTAQIIIVTDYDDDALREAAMLAGARGYALKDNLLDLFLLLDTTQRNHSGESGSEMKEE